MCLVHRYDRQNLVFNVHEIFTPQLDVTQCHTLLLYDWWCDYKKFQALHLPCTHVMVVCSSFHLQPHEVQSQFVQNEDYCSTYIGPNLILDPYMSQNKPGRPTTTRIHNEMDESLPNKPKKYSFCRSIGHNRNNCPNRQ